MIKRAVAEFFGRPPFDRLNLDKVVGLGAAAQADLLVGNRRGGDWLLLDVILLSLGGGVLTIRTLMHRKVCLANLTLKTFSCNIK